MEITLSDLWPYIKGGISLLGPTLTALAVLGLVWRKYIKPIHILINAQLRQNGGGSLTDKVDKLMHASSEDSVWRKEVDAHFKTIDIALSELNRKRNSEGAVF